MQKKTFFGYFRTKKKVPMTTKLEGETDNKIDIHKNRKLLDRNTTDRNIKNLCNIIH